MPSRVVTGGYGFGGALATVFAPWCQLQACPLLSIVGIGVGVSVKGQDWVTSPDCSFHSVETRLQVLGS